MFSVKSYNCSEGLFGSACSRSGKFHCQVLMLACPSWCISCGIKNFFTQCCVLLWHRFVVSWSLSEMSRMFLSQQWSFPSRSTHRVLRSQTCPHQKGNFSTDSLRDVDWKIKRNVVAQYCTKNVTFSQHETCTVAWCTRISGNTLEKHRMQFIEECFYHNSMPHNTKQYITYWFFPQMQILCVVKKDFKLLLLQ